ASMGAHRPNALGAWTRAQPGRLPDLVVVVAGNTEEAAASAGRLAEAQRSEPLPDERVPIRFWSCGAPEFRSWWAFGG
ncbi:MAG: hypothetical protein M3524_12875, partial [Actinomycetota bacterium]|nr:hypothetical protein [Actinomycetota bacterium]